MFLSEEIQLRAERKAGEFLKYTPKNRGAEGVGVRSHDVTTPTYKEQKAL